MKRAKPHNFDPFSVMSYHDLTQEARRLRRVNRKLRNEIRRRADEEGDSDKFVLENAPLSPSLGVRRTRERPANRALLRHGLPAGATRPFRD